MTLRQLWLEICVFSAWLIEATADPVKSESYPHPQRKPTMIPQKVTDALTEFADADSAYDVAVDALSTLNTALTQAQANVATGESTVSDTRATKADKRAALEAAIDEAFGA